MDADRGNLDRAELSEICTHFREEPVRLVTEKLSADFVLWFLVSLEKSDAMALPARENRERASGYAAPDNRDGTPRLHAIGHVE